MSADSGDFNQPYLPGRYRKKVRENQSRRLRKKLLLAGALVAIAAIAIFIFSGIFSTHGTPSPLSHPLVPASGSAMTTITVSVAPTVIPATNVTPSETYAFTVGPGVPVQASGDTISLSEAVASLREYYPAGDSSISSVNFSSGSNHTLFGFTLTPTTPQWGEDFVVFIDATTGEPYAPGQENAAITASKAKILALSAFPGIHPEQVKVWYANDPVKGGGWQFIFLTQNTVLARGTLDATTGDTTALILIVPHTGRPASPSIDQDKAKTIADQYISDHNGGPLSLNMTTEHYEDWSTASEPAAGQYVLTYERIFQDFPVDTDRIAIAVDSVTGNVLSYDKTWTTEDFAFSQTVELAVGMRDATFNVMQAAKTKFPLSVESVRIISADIRWNNRHTPGITQRPGSVPLAWKVLFDDATIRADPTLPQGIGWVDIQTGNVTELEYRH
ncbi:YcdB/YcdC domain-containing protein [Methanoregula sp.]|uniref:YcdB/YcdC domain-containing protein n=1 Tax=Methanoregula sp. TaxID=2052170 RepID=UPI003C1CE9D0